MFPDPIIATFVFIVTLRIIGGNRERIRESNSFLRHKWLSTYRDRGHLGCGVESELDQCTHSNALHASRRSAAELGHRLDLTPASLYFELYQRKSVC